MKYNEWKDAKVVKINGMHVTINQYAWILAILVNCFMGAVVLLALMLMLLKVDGVTPFMVGVMAGVTLIILTIGTIFLKKKYVEDTIDELHITEWSKCSKYDSED